MAKPRCDPDRHGSTLFWLPGSGRIPLTYNLESGSVLKPTNFFIKYSTLSFGIRRECLDSKLKLLKKILDLFVDHEYEFVAQIMHALNKL
jgi:hypothetical protein